MTPVTVFVADDHAIVRDGLVAHLSAQPDLSVIGTASNGRDALSQILARAPQIAVLDISMPELDGIEVTRRIVAERPDVRVIILSMHGGAQHIFQALEAGVRGYLLKESAGREIIEAIRAVQAGRRYLSPKVAEIVAENVGTRGGANPLESLSRREREILKLVADGHSSAEIGAKLHLSPKTVDSYRSRMMQKLHLPDLVAVIKFAIQHGLTTLE
jgi:DNA-binding NarL/FixJ family response regulator